MMNKRWLIFFSIVFVCHATVAQQHFELLPESKLISELPADPVSHRFKLENILITKNLRSSLGVTIPVVGNKNLQLVTGASVQFEVHPNGQAQIVSTEFYVDYFLIDVRWSNFLRTRLGIGHTSHHLSDNWYEKLQRTESVNYSRDYVKGLAVLADERWFVYGGFNYGFVFHLENGHSKRWHWQCGGEWMPTTVSESIEIYAAVDVQCFQETDFETMNNYQAGLKFSKAFRNVRTFYNFRHGIDERGQFFPRHRALHSVGVSVEI